MSRLDELIKELCPDGVEYKRLGEIASYSSTRISSESITAETYVGVDNLLPDKQGKKDSNYVPLEGNVISFDKGDILIGNIRPYLKKIWLSDCSGGTNGDVLVFQIRNKESILSKFLYYLLSSDKFFLYDMQHSKGAKMPRGNKKEIMQYSIPLPPMKVQSEIVKILDNFTELTADLTDKLSEELTARKKQYEYYRDRLLTFESIIPVKSLGELCEISAGGDVPKNSWSKVRSDKFKVPIISNGVGTNALYGYTDVAKITGPSVTIAARGTIGYAEYRDYPYFPIIRLLSLIPKDGKLLNTRYLYYCLQGKQYKVPTTGIPQLTAPVLKKVKIPVPEIMVQERIVNVLDNFDKVCNDLHIGLPAEIEARKKQYEFYRDSLLTFLEKGESILTDRQTDRTEVRPD